MNLLAADITQAIESKMDRSKWQKWQISDLVENINEKVSPKDSGLEHYIGLEHLDSGSLHIRRFGETASLTGDKLKIYKGDLIFAKRNAYLKRIAIAEFDAVASAHSLVLRARPEKVLPEFLPFFMLSEAFWERAIEISVGSLSPTINWRVLANQEFLLPPKNQQLELSELFWSIDKVINNFESMAICSRHLYESKREFENFIYCNNEELVVSSRLKSEVNADVQFHKLGDYLIDIKYGTSRKGNQEKKGYKVLGIPNVINETLTVDKCGHVDLDVKEFKSCLLRKGDIIIVRTNGNPEYTGRSALFNLDEEYVYASYLIKIAVDQSEFNPDFLVRYLQTNLIRRYFRRHATSTAGNYNINTEVIKNIPVPRISISDQDRIVETLKTIEQQSEELSQHLSSSKSLQKSIINQVFKG